MSRGSLAGWSQALYANQMANKFAEEKRRDQERAAQVERMNARFDESRKARLLANPHSALSRARREEAELGTEMEIEKSTAVIKEQYTQQQKMEMAKIANEHRAINNSEWLTPEQKAVANRTLVLKSLGDFAPQVMLMEKEQYPGGHPPGDMWQDEDGNYWRADQNGRKDMIPFKDTRAYFESQMELQQQEIKQRQSDAVARTRLELMKAGENQTGRGFVRNFSDEQIEDFIKKIHPGYSPGGSAVTGSGVTQVTSRLGPNGTVVTDDPVVQKMQQAKEEMSGYTEQQRVSGEYMPDNVRAAKKIIDEYGSEPQDLSRVPGQIAGAADIISMTPREVREAKRVLQQWKNGTAQLRINRAVEASLPLVKTEADFERLAAGQAFIDANTGMKMEKER